MYEPPARRIDKVDRSGRPTHSYQDALGRPMPGVTTILGDGMPKPALINWAANTTAEYAVNHWDTLADMSVSDRLNTLKKARYFDLDAAARRGTQVHGLAEKIIKDQEVLVPEELRGHVESYIQFLDDWKPRPMLIEATIINYRYGYAGTLDLVYELPDGTRVLADIKTTRSRIYAETALQLAAYANAEVYLDDDGIEQPMLEVDEACAIWVRADGYEVVPLDALGQDAFDDFRRVQQVAQLTKRIEARLLPAPILPIGGAA